jgi:hypothetical protein
LQQPTVTLPRQRDLVLPESTDASTDLRLAERPRPSPEQVRAQKGRQRLQALFSSLLNVAEHQWDAPVVIVNFTGYVEDAALAASHLWSGQCLLFPVLFFLIQGWIPDETYGLIIVCIVCHHCRVQVFDMKTSQNPVGSFDCKNRLHYLSIHVLDRAEFGKMRLTREITEAWMDQKLKIPGFDFSATPPRVADDEINKVPGAAVAMGSFDSLKLEVLSREGNAIKIKPDEAKFFRSINDAICDDFEQLHKDHQERFSQCFPAAP